MSTVEEIRAANLAEANSNATKMRRIARAGRQLFGYALSPIGIAAGAVAGTATGLVGGAIYTGSKAVSNGTATGYALAIPAGIAGAITGAAGGFVGGMYYGGTRAYQVGTGTGTNNIKSDLEGFDDLSKVVTGKRPLIQWGY